MLKDENEAIKKYNKFFEDGFPSIPLLSRPEKESANLETEEIIQTERQKEKRMRKNEQSLRDSWDHKTQQDMHYRNS